MVQSLIAAMQNEIPFDVIKRDLELPLDSGQIITILRVRRCGKSSLMMLAINVLIEKGVRKEQILKKAFVEYNQSGAFPEVVFIPQKSMKERKLQTYFNTMLFRDLIEHYKLSNPGLVRYFLKRIMSNLSKPTSIHAIYNDIKSQGLKVSKDKLYELADHACSIFLFFRVSKYDKSIIKENNSFSKYYCIDNGMRNAVLLPQSGDEGKLLENTVFLNLRRNCGPADKIYYYQGAKKCDFVLQQNEEITHLIQVSWTIADDETRKREIDGLVEASRMTECKNLLIITHDEDDEIIESEATIKVVSAWKWLLAYNRSEKEIKKSGWV